jgi:hypothetical protein
MSDVSVSLGVEGTSSVTGAFQEVGKAGKELGDALMEHTKKLAEMFVGYEALVKVMETFKGVLEMGGKLNDLTDQTGIAAGKLVILQRAFENTGLQADDLGKLVNKMQKFIEGAGDSGSASAQKLAKLGLTTEKLKAMAPDEQFQTIGKAIAAISDPTEKAAASMEIFGKSGGKTLALFNHLDEELGNAKAEVGTFAKVMDGSAPSFDRVGDSLKEIGNKALEFAAGIMADAMPALTTLTEYLKNVDATAFGQTFSAAFSKGIDITLSIFRDPGNLFLAFGESLIYAFKSAINVLDSGIVYVFEWAKNYLSLMFPQAAQILKAEFNAAFGFVASGFSKMLSEIFSGVAGYLPAKFGGPLAEIGNKLATVSDEWSNKAAEGLATAWDGISNSAAKATEQTHYQLQDFMDSETSAEIIAARLNDAVASGSSVRDEMAKSVEQARQISIEADAWEKATDKMAQNFSGATQSFKEFANGNSEASGLAAMSGISPYKSPINAGPINTAPAGGSSSASGRSSGRASSGPVLSDNAASNKTAADFSAYAGSNQFGDSAYNSGDISNRDTVISNLATALSRDANKLGQDISFLDAKAQATKMYDDQFNKNKGPQDQGYSPGGSSGGGSNYAPKTSPDSGVLQRILDALTSNSLSFVGQLNQKLPQHALV